MREDILSCFFYSKLSISVSIIWQICNLIRLIFTPPNFIEALVLNLTYVADTQE